MADRFAKLNASNPFGNRPAPRLDDLTDGMVEEHVEQRHPAPEQAHYYSALTVNEQGVIPGVNFEVSSRGLLMFESATYDDWREAGKVIKQFDDAMQFIVGDWVNSGARFEQDIVEIATLIGKDEKTIRNWASVCEKFPYALRKANLFFGHYNLVTGRFYKRSTELLETASRNNWTVDAFREYLRDLNPRKRSVKRNKKWVRDARKSARDFVVKFSKLTHVERHEVLEFLRGMLDELPEVSE